MSKKTEPTQMLNKNKEKGAWYRFSWAENIFIELYLVQQDIDVIYSAMERGTKFIDLVGLGVILNLDRLICIRKLKKEKINE